jgi:two-component system sensor kinase FixL
VLVGNSSVVDSGFLLEDQLITRTSLPVFNNYTHAVTGYLVARSASGNPGGSLTLSLSDFNFRYFLWMLTCIAFFLFHISLLFLLTWIIVKRMTNPLTRLSRATQQIADGELNIKIHIDRNDEIGMVAAHFNEMAERLRKNALIERRFRDLARTSTDWIWEIDKDYRFTYSNPAVKSLIGYSSKEILNKTPSSLSHYEDKDRLNKIISQLSHNKEPVKSIRHRIIRKDNTVCFLDISAVAVYDGQGTIVGFRGIGRDVTQQYYTEQERERLNKELIETNREIEQFVYSVSHDLQRPLLSMQSMIKLIEDEPLCTENPLVGSFLIRFQKSITSMGDMIEGLVEISKVGRVDMERDYVDVNELVQAIIDEIKLRLDTQNIVITISDSLPGVWCNRKRLTQIFSNLLDNAVKFMPKGRKGGIVIKGAKKDSALHYSVSDNGPGIDTKYHENIFQMFERLHGDSIAGNGMGLYFIKKIIESYNGKIWVESEPGRGAAFHFVLPVSENLSHSVRCNRKTPIPERAEV